MGFEVGEILVGIFTYNMKTLRCYLKEISQHMHIIVPLIGREVINIIDMQGWEARK